jgi:hypothetical protein
MTVVGLITIAAYAVLKRYKKRNDKINREEKRLQQDARPPALL